MIVAGFGYRQGATPESLRDAYARASPGHVAQALATAAEKCDHAALNTFAAEAGLPVIAVASHDLEAQDTLTVSAQARAAYNTGSVAEAAALAAAGPGARLAAARAVSGDRMATCAFAIGDPA